MKHLEGKNVWLIGTGNNAVRTNKLKVRTAKIIKVARVKATITVGENTNEFSNNFYERDGQMYLDSGYNSGYMLFESEHLVNDYILRQTLARLICENFIYEKDFAKLSSEKLTIIADTLGLTLE